MDRNGQKMRWCPVCKKDTDQQFTLVDENNENYVFFYNCLKCCEFEETTKEQKDP